MANEASLNRSINSAQKHYSSMFFLPSYRKALLGNLAVTAGFVGLSTSFFNLSAEGLISSLILGFSLFTLTFIADYTISKRILKNDPIYLLRRTVGLSLFCWIIWSFFILLGVIFGTFFGSLWWVKFCLVGYAGVLTLRALVFMATSSSAAWRRIVSALFQPLLCMLAFVAFWWVISQSVNVTILPFLVISPILACASVFLLLSFIDRLGKQTYGMESMPLFRAFMLNWVVGLNDPLEKILEVLGEDTAVEVSLLKFDSSQPKASIIVPLVHPGPFKNIGSSLLPSLLKQTFEKELGYITCVPLGILGHELDLASQTQNHKIIKQVVSSAGFNASASLATPCIKVREGEATASCQLFGDTALLSFTLAPKTTEDLPQELGEFVREEASRLGLKNALIINAHNSLTDTNNTTEYLDTLRVAASKCLQKTVHLQAKLFKTGAATVFPKEFNLKDGMGAGGITALVVQVENQKTAYVVIDGNNMIPHLRERILSELQADGFNESEVFTTDTHAVSAVITGRRGYHPIGEVMDHNMLISNIKQAAKAAEAASESSKAGFLRLVVPQVRVIGEARLKTLTTLVDKAIKRAKQVAVPIFGFEGLLLVILLLLF